MKNITKYFIDASKASTNKSTCFINDGKKETEVKTNFMEKQSCTTVEISKTRSTKSNCKQQNRHSGFVSMETNDDFNITNETQAGDSILNVSIDRKQYMKKSRNKNNCNHINVIKTYKNMKCTNSMDLLNVESNNEIKDNHEGSNAFQILMSRSNPVQCITPTKLFTQNESNTKESENYKERLKISKEKLIDKKRSFKRKISEVESERIDRVTQNPVKLFKEEKYNSTDTTILYNKQSSGSLLNYFSKTPIKLMNTNMADMSTIIVEADVHMSQNAIKCDSHTVASRNTVRLNKKDTTSDLQFSQVDDITVIKSENILNNKKDQKDQQGNKCRWSLRIKFQTYEDENTLPGGNNEEQLFSPRSKAKLSIKNSKRSEINKNICSENLGAKHKMNEEISKKIDESKKLKLRRHKDLECPESITIESNKDQKTKFRNVHDTQKSDINKPPLVQNKNLNKSVNIDVKSNRNNDFDEDDVIIIKDNSKKKSNKLAPLFVKQQKSNLKAPIAKQSLSQTNTKDNSDKNVNHKINDWNILPFPLISHITQLTNLACNKTNSFIFPQKVNKQLRIPVLNVNDYKHVIDSSEVRLKPSKNSERPKLEEVLTEIEKYCSGVKQMWNIISLTVKEQSGKRISPKTKSRRRKQQEKIGITKCNDAENQIKSFCWTYKYRPKSAEEVVGNEMAALKLKEWLAGWKTTFNVENDSSGDEFYSSDNSYSKINQNNQVAVLLGPHGSGKTASVYAVAEEFGYTVLELNASSKRTGKKLLKELEEATKSHQIKKEEKTSIFCYLTPNEMMVPKKISQKCLILIEDVDIVFEEDEGFISAICQLVSNTKRPIVMTCKDVCPHLNKVAPQQNRIHFKTTIGNKVSALLELITLAETGYKLPRNCIAELLQSGDLRKAILQLQYLLLSGPPQISEQLMSFKTSLWQNMQYHLYKPAMIVGKKENRKKNVSNKLMNNNRNVLNDMADKLDKVVLLSCLIDIKDVALNLQQLRTQPNLSLVENTALYSTCSDISLEIAEWLNNKIMCNDYDGIQCPSNITSRKQLNKEIDLTLSHTTALLLDHQLIATDYLPSIRTICRAEENKANINSKRGYRYFHYLHKIKSASLLKPTTLSAACKIMHDKSHIDMRVNEIITIE